MSITPLGNFQHFPVCMENGWMDGVVNNKSHKWGVEIGDETQSIHHMSLASE